MDLLNLVGQYIGFYLVFIVLSLITYYIPGFLIIKKSPQKLDDQEIISLSFVLGFVMFVITAFLLAFLNLRILMLPLILSSLGFAIFKYRMHILQPFNVFSKEKFLTFLMILGIFVLGVINFPSGFKYTEGLLFWSSQGHDGIWHVAVIEEIKKNLPAQNPLYSGEILVNYHYLIDVVMGEFNRIYPFFNSLDIYFRFFPILLAFMISISVYAFVFRWQGNKNIAFWALFFTLFCGSFGYIVLFLRDGTILGGETVFWAAQGNTILGNPPHAAAFAIIPALFLCFYIYLKERGRFWFCITFLIGSILAGFKVSGGMVMLAGLGAAALIDFIANKKFSTLILTGILSISNYITIKSMTRGAEGFLLFVPWWFVRTMVVAGNRLDWIDLEHKRQFYLAQGGIRGFLRVMQFEGIAFLIFLAGNMGFRIIGFVEIFRKYVYGFKKVYLNPFDVALLVTMLTGLIIPMLFVQKGIIYNNIQFFQYFNLIFGFFSAITTYKILIWIKNKTFKILFIILVLSFSLPTVLGNINEFYGQNSNPLALVSNEELDALKYLKENSGQDDIILNLPFNKYLQDKFKFQPRPIYAWYSTAYVSALTGRPTYLSSEEQVLITGYPVEERRSIVKNFFEGEDFESNKIFLKNAKIKFIYLPKKEIEKNINVEKNGLNKFFENREVIIYSVANDKV